MEHDPGEWYRPAHIHVVDHDDRWPAMFAAEADVLAEVLGDDALAIEHIGSTAVPGLAAKPVIDILVAVRDWLRFPQMVTALAGVGFVHTPESEAEEPGRRVFRKGPADMSLMRTHHLHVTLCGSHYRRRMLAFRDELRRDPASAERYAALKRHLAEQHHDDSRAYTRGKDDFVTAIEHRAGLDDPH